MIDHRTISRLNSKRVRRNDWLNPKHHKHTLLLCWIFVAMILANICAYNRFKPVTYVLPESTSMHHSAKVF